MYTGLYAAVSGSLAQEKRLAILTNNLANANTVGFKADRPIFQVEPLPTVIGTLPAADGSGTVIAALDRFQGRDSPQTQLSVVQTDFTPGDLRDTGNPLDLALQGRGFFAVQTPDGVAYTRQGICSLNAEGVLVTSGGLPVLGDNGPLRLRGGEAETDPTGRVSVDGTVVNQQQVGKIEIDPTGRVSVNGTFVDRLKIVDFAKPETLEKQGDVLFRSVVPNPPTTTASAVVRQGVLETANVEPVRLLVSVMETSRAYEAYQKVIQAFNDIAGRAVNDIAGRV